MTSSVKDSCEEPCLRDLDSRTTNKEPFWLVEILYYIMLCIFYNNVSFYPVIKISGKQCLRVSPFLSVYYEPVEFVSGEEFQDCTVGILLASPEDSRVNIAGPSFKPTCFPPIHWQNCFHLISQSHRMMLLGYGYFWLPYYIKGVKESVMVSLSLSFSLPLF